MAGLEILESFAFELDHVVLEKRKLMKIKCLILEQMPQKFIELFEIMLIKPIDPDTLERSLRTLKMWTSIKLQILSYSEKIVGVLLDLFENCNEERMELITDILCEGFKGAIHADILDSTNMMNAQKLITEIERMNIQKIIEFLGVRHLERYMKAIKNESSGFARCYTEILTNLAEKFPIFILEVDLFYFYSFCK